MCLAPELCSSVWQNDKLAKKRNKGWRINLLITSYYRSNFTLYYSSCWLIANNLSCFCILFPIPTPPGLS